MRLKPADPATTLVVNTVPELEHLVSYVNSTGAATCVE